MRLKRIETVRLITMFLIVWAHTQFFNGIKADLPSAPAVGELVVVMIARYSIPFFFIVSGYFLGGKIVDDPSQAHAIAWKYSKKLLLLFVFWSAVYALENPETFMRLLTKDPVTLIFEGTRIHLWFLVSLALAIWSFALWPLDRKGNSFVVFALALNVLGLLGGSYLPTPVGIHLDFNTRNAIFFSALYFGMGAWIHAKKPSVSPALAWGIYLFGQAMFCLEVYLLYVNWSALPIRHDYLVGSIPFGVGIFLVALTSKRETKLDTALEPYSKYVLGIYVAHLLVLDLWKPLGVYFPVMVWFFVMPVLVFGSTLLGVILLSKTPLRRFVM